jgi:hypothetical protein
MTAINQTKLSSQRLLVSSRNQPDITSLDANCVT